MAVVQIDAWAKRVGLTLDEAARGITIKLFEGVIMDTRVDTGRMRGNWQASIANPIKTEIETTDAGGSTTVNRMTSTVRAGEVNYMTNNVPYAPYWEQQDGMIAKNMARITRIVKEEVAKAK